jgi:hypothetical protein
MNNQKNDVNGWSAKFLETVVALAERMNVAPAELLVSGFKRAGDRLRRRSRPITDEYAEAQCKSAEEQKDRSSVDDIVNNIMKK